MAVIKRTLDNNFEIILTLSTNFIRKYNLNHLVRNPRPTTAPYDEYWISLGPNESFEFPFVFPPFEVSYPAEYLEFFLSEIRKFLPNERNVDELLFMAYLLPQHSTDRDTDKFKANRLKIHGKLLLDLLKFPFKPVNKANIMEFVEDENELLSYFCLCSGDINMHLNQFVNEKGKIDKRKISEDLWVKVMERIHLEKNIRISLPGEKFLVISKEITVKFNSNFGSGTQRSKKAAGLYLEDEFFQGEGQRQNEEIIKLTAESIIAKQKEHNTEFYNALLSLDPSENNGLKKLSDILAIDNKTSHIWKLKRLSEIICSYFHDENIKRKIGNNNPSGSQLALLYRYFLLLGLLFDENGEQIHPFSNLLDLKRAVNTYKSELLKNPKYGSNYLKYAFKG